MFVVTHYFRNECDTVAGNLMKAGIQAVSYHAGLSDGERITVQESWLKGYRCKVFNIQFLFCKIKAANPCTKTNANHIFTVIIF